MNALLTEIRGLTSALRGMVTHENATPQAQGDATDSTAHGQEAASEGPIVRTESVPSAPNPRPHRVLWGDEVGRLLKRANTKAVLLSACESARRDSGKFRWAGVAPALLRAGVPVVIGMQYLISDNTAVLFSENFYKGMAAGLTVDQAVALGRRAIMDLDEDDRDQDWGVPVLYARTVQQGLAPQVTGSTEGIRDVDGYEHTSPEALRSELLNNLYSEYNQPSEAQ